MDAANDVSDLNGVITEIINGTVWNHAYFMANDDKANKEFRFENSSRERYDLMNSHRGRYDVPSIDEMKEVNGWMMFESAVSSSDFPKQYENMKESGVAARKKTKN